MFSDVMGSKEAQICFYNAFLVLLKEKLPICNLDTLPHWHNKDSSLTQNATYFLGGYFYNFFTPTPSKELISEHIGLLKKTSNATQIIIPSVRNEESSFLRNLGFCSYNLDKELLFLFNGNVDSNLRDAIGSHRFRQIKRLHRKSFEKYTFEWLVAKNINNKLLDEFDKLDIQHTERHKSVRRIYTKEVYDSFTNSLLSNYFRWYIRRDTKTNDLVQVGFLLLGEPGGTVYYLNQSINRENCASDHNLYVASFYEIYKYAEQMDYKCVHMGRGTEQAKLNLGANTIIEQASWIVTL